MIAFAFIVGILIASKEAERKGIGKEMVFDFLPWAILGGILGARLYYVLFYDLKFYLQQPLRILFFWEGGLAFHGGFLLSLLIGIHFTRSRRISLWTFADTATPSIILGQAIGRLGCFLNGCCYGVETRLPWGVNFTHPDSIAPSGIIRHPTQLYQLLLNLAVFSTIWKLRRRERYGGFLFLIYLILYSISRSLVESFRADSLYLWRSEVRAAHLMGGLIIILSLIGMWYLKKKGGHETRSSL